MYANANGYLDIVHAMQISLYCHVSCSFVDVRGEIGSWFWIWNNQNEIYIHDLNEINNIPRLYQSKHWCPSYVV